MSNTVSISVERLEDAITTQTSHVGETTRDVWRARIRSQDTTAGDDSTVVIPLTIATRATDSAREH